MPTLVKQRLDTKPETAAKANGLGAIVLLLGIVLAAGLLATILPMPPSVVPGPDAIFFAP